MVFAVITSPLLDLEKVEKNLVKNEDMVLGLDDNVDASLSREAAAAAGAPRDGSVYRRLEERFPLSSDGPAFAGLV